MVPACQPTRTCNALRCALVVLLFGAGIAVPALAADQDHDRVGDETDNCLDVSNMEQIDTDGDGCGNACDADYDQSGMVDAADFAYFRLVMGRKEGDTNFDANVDHDNNGQINGGDFIFFRGRMSRPPGPSLITSRNTVACP